MHGCDIRQYLIRQNVFCTILPNILSPMFGLVWYVTTHTSVIYWPKHAITQFNPANFVLICNNDGMQFL